MVVLGLHHNWMLGLWRNMKKHINTFSSYASKWYSLAVVIFIAQFALDGHSPGYGRVDATTASIIQNSVMSLCVGIVWKCVMEAIVAHTRVRFVLDMSESNRVLNELLIQATNKQYPTNSTQPTLCPALNQKQARKRQR